MKHVSSPKQTWLASGLLLILLLLAGPVVRAQVPAWQSAVATNQANGPGNYCRSISTAADANGNVYIVGDFSGTVIFGSSTLTSAGNSDVFIAKWSAITNRLMWAIRAGGQNGDGALSVAVAGANVYVTGSFNSRTADFGSFTLTNSSTLLSPDVFIAKMTDSGTFVWALQAGGANTDLPQAIAVDGPNVYTTGRFISATASFGSTVLTNAGGNAFDAFVTKVTDAGPTASFTWAQQVGGTGNDNISGLAVSGSGVYLAGLFDGPTTILGSLAIANSTADGKADGFAAKLTDAGATAAFVWAQRMGGPGNEYAIAVAAKGPTLYVGGEFSSPGFSLGTTALAGTGMFITKIMDDGSSSHFVWAQQSDGTCPLTSTRVVRVVGPNVYVGGLFSGTGTAAFGSTILTNTPEPGTTPPVARTDGYVAKFTDTGTQAHFDWVKQIGGVGFEEVRGLVAIGPVLYAAGWSNALATFDNLNVANPALDYLGFLASLTDPTLTATTAARSDFAFALAPNPAHGSASVQLPAVPGAATATLTLLDALGR
ncbi:MAG: hypothetical protein M3Y54_17180, partial [Bacteroidota bacterium]|nr:hypothetical protein [Bacteroidota bacterium]